MFDGKDDVLAQLDSELILWLTTVSEEGQPQSSAVWFLRDGEDLLVYSRADATRLTNLAANDRVAMNLRGDPQGDLIVTMEGRAVVVESAPPAHMVGAYIDKYGDEIIRLGWTHEEFGALYPSLIRIVVSRVRAWS